MDNDNKIKSEIESENEIESSIEYQITDDTEESKKSEEKTVSNSESAVESEKENGSEELSSNELAEIVSKKELTAKDFIPSQQIHKEVRMFLDSELATLHQQAEVQIYNLESEYAKTRKHKSPLSWIILGVCFIVVVSTVFVITTISSRNDKNLTVELTEFDDLNLKSLLDTVAKVQSNYDDSVKSRSTLLSDKEVALRAAEAKRLQDEFVIESLKLSAKEESQRLENIQKEYEATIAQINNEFEPKIQALEAEIEGYEKQLKEYDAAKVEAAQEQERLLNSERRVQELERKKMAQQYESRITELEKTINDLRTANNDDMFRSITTLSEKYQDEINGLDPSFTDEIANAIIEKADEMRLEEFSFSDTVEKLENSEISSQMEQIQALYEDYSYLHKAVAALPQKNSIPSYVEAAKILVDNLGNDFSSAAKTLYADSVNKSYKINRLEYKVDSLYNEYNGLIDEYNNTIDEFNDTIDEYDEEISDLKTSFADEKKNMIQQHEEAMHNQEVTITNNLTTSLTKKLTDEKNQALDAQQKKYEECLDTIIVAAKVTAAVESVKSKDDIRIYIIPQIRSYITEAGIAAEIKAAKSIKGTVVKATDEKNQVCYKFVPAKDKTGAVIPFDFASVKSGLPVKINVKVK